MCFSLLASWAGADRVVLSDGREQEGVILREEPGLLEMETAGGRLRLPAHRVQFWEKAAAGENGLLLAGYRLLQDRPEEALDFLKKAQAQKAGKEQLARWIDTHGATLARELVNQPRSGLGWADYLLAPIWREPGLIKTETRMVLARAFLQSGHSKAAFGLFFILPPSEVQRHSAFARNLLQEEMRRMLDAAQGDGLALLFETARPHFPDWAKVAEAWTALYQSSLLRSEGQFFRAMELLREKLAPPFPALARERMACLYTFGIEKLRQAGQWEKALEWVDRFSNEAEGRPRGEHRRALLQQQARAALDQKDWEGAQKAIARYGREEMADPNWLQAAQGELELGQASEKAEGQEWEALGRRAETLQQWEDAARFYDRAAQAGVQPDKNLNRAEKMEWMKNAALLDRCEIALGAGRYRECLELADALRSRPLSASQSMGLRRLRKKCVAGLQSEGISEAGQAWSLLDKVEKNRSWEKLEAQERRLQMVIDQFPETPAAERARQYLERLAYDQLLEKWEAPVAIPCRGRVLEPKAREALEKMAAILAPKEPDKP